jgi:hypothetical protein
MIDSLRRRESATAAMIRDIDDKLSRLNSARKERAAALNRIRCELVRAHNAEQVASARHERANGIH